MKASLHFHRLHFNVPSGTSRGVLTHKDSWFLRLQSGSDFGWGECSVIPGLSPDIKNGIYDKVESLINEFNRTGELTTDMTSDFPALNFAFEMALLDMLSEKDKSYFPNSLQLSNKGIPINGLIWMGETDFMKQQIREKIKAGFSCLKLKIAALDFNEELAILRWIRQEFKSTDLTLRVDANGGFSPSEALEKLEQLAQFDIHSIEQPIAAGQVDTLNKLCKESPIPIALDEELIGVNSQSASALLQSIKPQYIILKPSLLGGFQKSDQWIASAERLSIGWWATSALESNLGLYAIAEWTATKKVTMPQGLGTGGLFQNNIQAPLMISNAQYPFACGWPIQRTPACAQRSLARLRCHA